MQAWADIFSGGRRVSHWYGWMITNNEEGECTSGCPQKRRGVDICQSLSVGAGNGFEGGKTYGGEG